MFITQFVASITSDSIVNFTNNNSSGDSNFSLKRLIEGILENIGNNKKEANTLVSIEFVLNLFAKNFAAYGCAETMGEAVLRNGYGQLVCANLLVSSKLTTTQQQQQQMAMMNNNNNPDGKFLDLLAIVDYFMRV